MTKHTEIYQISKEGKYTKNLSLTNYELVPTNIFLTLRNLLHESRKG